MSVVLQFVHMGWTLVPPAVEVVDVADAWRGMGREDERAADAALGVSDEEVVLDPGELTIGPSVEEDADEASKLALPSELIDPDLSPLYEEPPEGCLRSLSPRVAPPPRIPVPG